MARTVRFTGARTGMTEIALSGHGIVHIGDLLEVPDFVADVWTRPLPVAGGAELADFEDAAEVPLPEDPGADDEEATDDVPEPIKPTRRRRGK